MTTSEHSEAAALTTKQFIAFLIATVCLSIVLNGLRTIAKDYQTWLMWLLAAMIAAVSTAAATALYRRHGARKAMRRE